MVKKMIVINAENKVFGRLCSEVAEKLLKYNEKIIVVNSRKAVISGNFENIYAKYFQRTERGGKGNPGNNPKYPRYPDRLVKRSVRGMLPRRPRGVDALKKLTVYIDVPENFKHTIPEQVKLKNMKYVTLEDISKKLGAKYSI
jgi:large subunit ribosomal protein L13